MIQPFGKNASCDYRSPCKWNAPFCWDVGKFAKQVDLFEKIDTHRLFGILVLPRTMPRRLSDELWPFSERLLKYSVCKEKNQAMKNQVNRVYGWQNWFPQLVYWTPKTAWVAFSILNWSFSWLSINIMPCQTQWTVAVLRETLIQKCTLMSDWI